MYVPIQHSIGINYMICKTLIKVVISGGKKSIDSDKITGE